MEKKKQNSKDSMQDNVLTSDELPTVGQLEGEVRRRKYIKNYFRIIKSTISSLIVVAAIAVIIATLLLPVLRVTGSSMSPTLENDELVICQKTGNFKRGDIIAFYYNNKILLKRVIALSGDYVSIDAEGTVYVNDVAIDEPYVSEKALGECDIEFPYLVQEERIFVMGDRRSTSVDSRSTQVGCVAEESIIGRVSLRVWPFEKLEFM